MYSFKSRIRYSETDSEEVLTIPAMINYLQDTAIYHTFDLRVGKGGLYDNNCAWMICSWQLEILRYPKFGDEIVVNTWPYGFRSIMGERNCTICTKDGEVLVKVNSIWIFMDLTAQRPVKVSPEVSSIYNVHEKLDMDYKPRKITIPDEGGERLADIVVESHHLDSLGHVNNGQYVRMALALKSMEGRPHGLRVEYKMQAHLGDVIRPVRYMMEDGEIIALESADGGVYATVELVG